MLLLLLPSTPTPCPGLRLPAGSVSTPARWTLQLLSLRSASAGPYPGLGRSALLVVLEGQAPGGVRPEGS